MRLLFGFLVAPLLSVLADSFAAESVSPAVLEDSPEPVELILSPRRRTYSSSPRRRTYSSPPRRRTYSGGSSYGGGGSVTRVTRTSAGDEVGKAFKDMMIGFLLVFLAFPCLYYNERRQVHMEKIFSYAKSHIKDVSADKVDEDNQASIICVRGESSTSETLKDPQLNVEVQNCAKLSRSVEMYQWIETQSSEERDTSDGGKETKTTYSYRLDWSSSAVDSGSFNQPNGHENPPFPSVKAQTWTAKAVNLGAFKLTQDLIGQMCNTSPADIEAQELDGKMLEARGKGVIQSGGGDALGDVRIKMTKVECGPCSVASIQSGDSFEPLTYALVPAGSCCGGTPDKVDLSTAQLNPGGGDVEVQGLCSCVGAMVEAGECIHNLYESQMTGQDIVAQMEKNQQCTHTALQIAGFFMFFIGDYFILKFGGSVFRFIPWIGTWIDYIWASLAMIAACLCACQCWLITIAVSWLAMRPMKGIAMLVLAGGLFAAMNILSATQSSGAD